MISKYNISFCFIFMLKIFFFTESSPAYSSSMLDDFNAIFRERGCDLPKQIVLENVTKISQTSSLDGEEEVQNIDFSIPLAVCAVKVPPEKNRDANICLEVFEVLNNISTCSLNSTVLEKIKTSINISIDEEICDEFHKYKSIFPNGKEYVAYTLTEPNICSLICHGDAIRDACTLLLWAYRTQTAIYDQLEDYDLKNSDGQALEYDNLESNGNENLQLSDGNNAPLISPKTSSVYDRHKHPGDENNNEDFQHHSGTISEAQTFTSSTSIQKSDNTIISSTVQSQATSAKSSFQNDDEIQNKAMEVDKGIPENLTSQPDATKNTNPIIFSAAASPVAKSQENDSKMLVKGISEKQNNTIDRTISLKNHDVLKKDKINFESAYTLDSQKPGQQDYSSISAADINNQIRDKTLESKATTVKSKATTVKSNVTTMKSNVTTVNSNAITVKSNATTGNKVSHIGKSTIEPPKSRDPHKMGNSKKPSESKSSISGKNNGENKLDAKIPEKIEGEKISSLIYPEKTKSDSMKLNRSDTLVKVQQGDLEMMSVKPKVKNTIGGTTKLISSAEEVLLENMEEGNTASFNDDGNIDDSSDNYTPKPEDYDITVNQQELRNPNSESKKLENNPETMQSEGSQSVNAMPVDSFDDGRSMGGGKPFPEQEDTHFFFYFISIIAIIIGLYLLFHNKQKIIALIIEGRHEKKRRLHNINYKKLDTK